MINNKDVVGIHFINKLRERISIIRIYALRLLEGAAYASDDASSGKLLQVLCVLVALA